MRRHLLSGFIVFVVFTAAAMYFSNRYWIHRYDDLIARQASVYRLDESLVWSVIYEETYFRAWQIGADDEVGLMQVTPTVAREWAKETGFREFEKQTAENVVEFLREPERNIQIGCWYLEKMRGKYRGFPAEASDDAVGLQRGREPRRRMDAQCGSRANFRKGIYRTHRNRFDKILRHVNFRKI
ncbi:MAG: transglycosylase SLT domain-containing protein [Pyrinomonadaceae bacterium]